MFAVPNQLGYMVSNGYCDGGATGGGGTPTSIIKMTARMTKPNEIESLAKMCQMEFETGGSIILGPDRHTNSPTRWLRFALAGHEKQFSVIFVCWLFLFVL